MLFQCRGWESIPRPRAYESPALPLSYLGGRVDITMGRLFCQRFLIKNSEKLSEIGRKVLDFALQNGYNQPLHICRCFCPQWDVAFGIDFPLKYPNSGESYGICPTREELRSYPGYA